LGMLLKEVSFKLDKLDALDRPSIAYLDNAEARKLKERIRLEERMEKRGKL
jgi:hypothetical protein